MNQGNQNFAEVSNYPPTNLYKGDFNKFVEPLLALPLLPNELLLPGGFLFMPV
jgi:hypothetical protein